MRILIALPGLHKVRRGAEIVLEAVAGEIAAAGRHQVVVAGSGSAIPGRPYEFVHVPARFRTRYEHWPKLPFLRSEFMYEELSFASSLARRVPIDTFDVTLTCGFPYMNLLLRRSKMFPQRGKHIFVTQNGDWAACGGGLEPRFFACDGLICTNPIYYERNKDRWTAALIPNGIDPSRFRPGLAECDKFGFPSDKPVILMASALEAGKRVIEAMHAVARVPEAHLVVAGDGPLRDEVDALAARLLPGRFRRSLFAHEDMPGLYRSCDLFLHTCIGESFGNVYIEALSSGARVVAHDDEVTRWILGSHARLIDTTDGDRLASAISSALAAPDGASGEAVRYAHQRFGWGAVAGAYAGFCEAVLAREPAQL